MPFYIGLGISGDALSAFSVFRVVRLVRVFRVFKMGKSSIGINLMVITIQESAKVLFILCYFVAIAMILFSSMMYYAEMENSQAAFFASIPRTFWWCLVTMTTVGYGDGYPVTPVGRIIAVITMFSGILILALPISVIGSNFAATYERLAFEMGAQKKVVDRKDKKGTASDAKSRYVRGVADGGGTCAFVAADPAGAAAAALLPAGWAEGSCWDRLTRGPIRAVPCATQERSTPRSSLPS